MQQIEKANNIEDKKLLAYGKIIRGIAKTNLLLNVSYKQACELLKAEIIKEAREQNPLFNNSKIGIITGINRKQIPEIENSKKPKFEPTPLVRIIRHLNSVCEKNKCTSVAIKGELISFKGIVDSEFKGQESYKAILNDGISKGCFSIENGRVVLKKRNITYKDDPVELCEYIGEQIRLILETSEFNYHEKDTTKKKVQRTIWSANIPEEKHPIVEKELSELIKNTADRATKILDSHEDNGTDSCKVGVFEKIGLFFSVFSGRKPNR